MNAEDTSTPTTDGTCTGTIARLFALIAASYKGDSPPDPCASESTGHSLRKASYAPTAAGAAVA